MRAELIQKVSKVITDQANIEQSLSIDEDVLRNTELDSLDCAEIWIELECQFDIQSSSDDFETCETVSDVAQLVEKLL